MIKRKPPRRSKKERYQPPRLERLGSLREVTAKTGGRVDNRPNPKRP